MSGSIVLDLHRMNKIIEVNEKLAYAVVEPGVTFADLYDSLRKQESEGVAEHGIARLGKCCWQCMSPAYR